MIKYVLDASALLAFLAGEPGGDAVEEALPSALVSTVNMSEVIAKLLERTMSEDEVQEVIPCESGCLIAPSGQGDLGTLPRYLYRGGKTARAVLTAVNISNHSFYYFAATNTFFSRYFG